MKKTLFAFFVSLAIIISLSACGEGASLSESSTELSSDTSSESNSSSGSVITDIASYSEGYSLFKAISEAMTDKINTVIDKNNYALEKADPENFYNKSGYAELSLPLAFVSVDMAFTSEFDEDTSGEEIEAAMIAFFDECTFTKVDKNSYRVDYTVKNKNEEKEYSGYFTAEYDVWTGSIKFESYSDESGSMEMTEFAEMTSLGDDKYALLDMDEQALVKYENGEITEIFYAQNKHGYDEIGDQSYYNEAGIYKKETLDKSWTERAQNELQCFIEYSGGKMTVDVRKCEIERNVLGKVVSANWTWGKTAEISG